MKAATSTTNRRRRSVPKATSSHKGMQPVLPPEYQAIFTKNGRPMLILEADATISLINAEFEKLSGYTKKQIEGNKQWTEFVAMADRKRMREYHRMRRSDPILAPRCFEFQFVDRQGAVKNVVITIGQIPGTNKNMASLMDVTDRRRAEKALKESEAKYRDIFDSMLEGYFEVDLKGNFTFFNKAVSKFFGYSRDELMGLNYQKCTFPEETQRLFQIFSEVFTTGKPHEIDEYKIIKKDGSIGIAEFSVSLLRNTMGEPIGFRGVTRDVTEKKNAQETLRLSEESYRKILDLAPQGITITRMKDERHLLVNDAFCQNTGYSAEETVGRTALELNLFVDRADRKRLAKAAREKERTDGLEIQFRAKDGTILNNLVSAKIIRFQDEDCLLAVTTDINELKKAQQALHKSEEKYRTILETMQEGYWETDLAGNFTYVNNAECRIAGTPKEQLIGTNNLQYTDETTAKKMYEVFSEIYKTGKAVERFEFEIIRTNGTKGFVECSASLIRDEHGKPIGFRGVTRDITDRKQAEEDLRESEEKYRSMLANIGDAYTETDLAGKVTFFNQAVSASLGYTAEEFIGMHYKKYTASECIEKIYEIYNKVYKTGEPAKSVELEYIAKDGTRKILESTVDLMCDKSGTPIGFTTFTTDITQQRRAEEALRRSEERYRSIIETMQEAYYETDLAGNYTFVNDALCINFGYTKEELIGTKSLQHQDEANAKKTYHAFKEIYRTGKPIKALEVEYSGKDGAKGTFALSASLIRDAQGNPTGFRGVTYDITERKLAEERLRQSEEKYRKILEKMQEGYFEMDLAGNFTLVNDAECRNLGYSREELIGMNNRQYQDETTAKRVYQVYNQIYQTGEPVKALEVEVIRKDRTKVFNETSVSLIRDAQGKPIGFRGLTRDVTERKMMEEELLQSEERYRSILGIIGDAYTENDLAGNMTFLNKESFKFLGWSGEEFVGMTYKDYTTPENAKKLFEIYNRVYKTGEPERFVEYELLAKDGTTRIAEATVELRRDKSGKPIGFRSLSRDITQRKQMEEALQLRVKQLAALGQASQAVATSLELDQVLNEVVSLANEAVASDYTSVVLIDESGRLIRSADNVPSIPSIERRVREKGFTNWIINSHKALIIDEIGEDGAVISPADLDEGVPRHADLNLVKAGIKSLAGLPLVVKDHLLGVLYLHGVSPAIFRGQQSLLTTFANQAAIAIENARLFEASQHELTERKRAEEHLQRYAEELERSNEEVKNFAYIVSHDLRVPLVNLKGYTSELRSALGVIGSQFDTALPHLTDEACAEVTVALHEDVPEALEFITNAVSRMDSFINAVLILSRLGRRELKPEPLDMEAVVQMSLENLSHQIQEHGIEVTVGSLPDVVADRTAMEQIVGNILGNAVKYIDPERSAKITVTAKPNNTETIFRIQDTGRGIAQDDMHKVFAPFRRAGKQDTPGEGMGLAYVQTLVRRHGGRIWCESEVGKGTTFTFTIATPSGQGAHDV